MKVKSVKSKSSKLQLYSLINAKVEICYFHRVTILLVNNLSLTLVEIQQLVGNYYSCLLPRENGRISLILVNGKFSPA